jgi:hypothetical protein
MLPAALFIAAPPADVILAAALVIAPPADVILPAMDVIGGECRRLPPHQCEHACTSNQ